MVTENIKIYNFKIFLQASLFQQLPDVNLKVKESIDKYLSGFTYLKKTISNCVNSKLILSLVFIGIICNQNLFSQEAITDTAKKVTADSTKLEEISAQLKELNKAITKIKDGKDEKQFIGIISMNNNNLINVYPFKKQQVEFLKKEVKVIKITMQVKDGYIVDINVYTNNDETFTNTQSPITISTRRFSDSDYLQGIHNRTNSILLKDFLTFEPYKTYLPEDGFIVLDSTNKSDSLFRNVGVNTILDLRLYSDALSLFGKESNGIAQTDISIKHILNRINVNNTGGFLGHYFKINLNAAKFDSKNNFVDSSSFSRTLFLQRSWINAELAYNILTTWIEKKSLSSFYLDIGAGINASNLALKSDTITITGQNIFAEAGFNLKSSDNIGIDLYTRLIANYSPQTYFVINNSAEKILKFGGEVYWNPLSDRAGRVFGRFNYVMSTLKDEKKNHFFQAQLGYSVLLSKAIKSGNE